MKKTALVILAFVGVVCAAGAWAQTALPGPTEGVLDLPSYPDARLEVEMNVSDQDILPMFKDIFMSVLELGDVGMKAMAKNPEAAKMMGPMAGLKDVLGDVQIMEALKSLVEPIEQVKLQIHKLQTPDPRQAVQEIGDFYKAEFAKRGWLRIFMVNEEGSDEFVTAYSLAGSGGLAFLVVDSGESGTEIINFGMKGLPDLAKMFRTLGPVLGQVIEKMPMGMMMGTMSPPGAAPEVEEVDEIEEDGEE